MRHKTYGDLYEYLNSRISFHENEEGQQRVEGCDNTLRHVKAFCQTNSLDFPAVKKALEETHGYCDCEVLNNSSDTIEPSRPLPTQLKVI